MNTPPDLPPRSPDPREFALQLAVVAERLDQRSALAVARVEAAGTALEQTLSNAGRATLQARMRLLWIASIGLLLGALVAVAGATFALTSAKRELAAITRDQALLEAINAADLTLCGDRLCARVEPGDQPLDARDTYLRIAPR